MSYVLNKDSIVIKTPRGLVVRTARAPTKDSSVVTPRSLVSRPANRKAGSAKDLIVTPTTRSTRPTNHKTSENSSISRGYSKTRETIIQRARVDSKKPKEKLPSDGISIGDYILGATIGQGTFGQVKVGIHIRSGEKVAIKILEKAKIGIQKTDVERVEREIRILKCMRHPNIIQLYEVIDTDFAIYLIMEFADGGEMFEYIVAKTRIPEAEATKLFLQLVDGLEYLHSKDVTHRDLKPENLLLQSTKNNGWILKIVDFGLSNTHENGRLLKTACGSPCYAAPEMIAGNEVPFFKLYNFFQSGE